MNWKLRFLISTIYRNMPFYRHFRSILRKYRRPKWIFATHDWALIHAIKQIEMLKSVNFDVTYKNILEIGTGWSPISPIIYSLVGAKSITTVDIDYCLSEDSFFVAVDGIANKASLVSDKIGISKEYIEQTLASLRGQPMDKALLTLNIKYLPDCNILKDFNPDTKYDVICSRAVLEHISPDMIKIIMNKCRKLISNNGKMLHIIDNSDHWEHQDKSISRINFLYHSDFIMSILNMFNPQDYQNRLRNYEYIDIFKNAGFYIELNNPEIHIKTLQSIDKNRLNKKFHNMKDEELASVTSYIICKPAF